jgi:hypothetical protein
MQRRVSSEQGSIGAAALRGLTRRRDDRLEAELQPTLNLFGDSLKISCRAVWGNPSDNPRLFDKSARGSDEASVAATRGLP